MKRVLIVLVVAFCLGAPAPLIDAQSLPDFRVIVNSRNSVDSLSKDEISQIFLKKIKQWSDGSTMQPVDLNPDSPLREAFCQDVHGRSVASIRSYWQRMIFSGREVPAPEKATETEVVQFVASNPGAIGYVRASSQIAGPVKVLKVTD
ncbi:MAG: hypothetical protein GY906_30410 [bacterium]|nr:hypothetical protein [bacterium]